MSEEYKNFNEYEAAPEEPAEEKPEAAEAAAPDPNPPTGWAPGFDEKNSTSVEKSSAMGIISIILSIAGWCYGIPSFIGIFVGLSAYRSNKFDVTAKVGLTACILMCILWGAMIAFYVFTPTGRAMMAEIMEEFNRQMAEAMSGTDIYYLFVR